MSDDAGFAIVMLIIASFVWFAMMLGMGSTPKAGRGRSYVDLACSAQRNSRAAREACGCKWCRDALAGLPRTPPKPYNPDDDKTPFR